MGRPSKVKNHIIKNRLTYWQDQLQGCSPVLNFPYDFPRPSVSTGYGDRVYLTFPERLSTELRSISRKEGVSLFSVIAATFGILMHKYSGDYDLNIGTPIANRTMADIEPMVGMFNNTLAIRFIFDHNSSFERVIKSISEVIMGAIENQDVPFEKIVELVNPERISNVNPLFQVAFAWEDNLEVPVDFKGVTSSRESIEGGASTFDLTCALADNGKEITGEIEYNTDLFKHDTVTRLRDNYLALVSNLVEDYRKPIESIPLITPKEKEKILGFTDTSTPYPSEKTISDLFEEQAEKYPDKDAVVYENQSVTYDQLNRKSNSLARRLIEKGIRKNKPVGILADKSIDLITGIHAILKSGGAYLPLDTDYPAERIKFMLSDAGCNVVLTHGKYGEILPKDVTKIFLDDPNEYHSEDSNVVTDTTSTDMAYIMYTSGTTGIPKGSMIRHKSVVRLVRNTNYIDLTPEDRILMTGAIVFDATTFEIWGSLLNGGTLYILNKEDILDSNALGASLRDNKITILWLTSPLFTQIAGVTTTIFSGLKYLLVGGDVLSPRHINMVREANKGLTVINGYGPTENTTFTTCYHIDRDYDHNIPIGKPVSNTTVYILDKNLNLQPIGVTGEIYVGGDGLSMGYLNRDDLNNKSFIANPWKRGEKLYRTGDHGRWQQSGDIEFHGRVDNQVKVRGFRVEPGEIEAALGSIEGVIDVVVKAFKISANDTRLVAFLNVKKTFDKEISEISGILRAKIPSYMVPSIYRIMDGFPLTINGKIDRDALKYEEDRIAEDSNKEDIKLTETEREIHNIWSDVLKIKNIHPDDNFFDIGGNSLLVISVVNRIEEHLNVGIQFKDINEHPTLKSLGKFIENKPNKTELPVRLTHSSKREDLPLTNSQLRIWLLNRLNPDSPYYIITFIYRLYGSLNIDVFKRSIQLLFDRHHVLFSSFYEKQGDIMCRIDSQKAQVNVIDLRKHLLEKRKQVMLESINNDSREVMDLSNGPLYRMHLYKLSEEENYLYFAVHHIVFDGWSWKIFIEELNHIYNSLLSRKPISLKKVEYQQYDFAAWEKQTVLSKDNRPQLTYWQDQLQGCSPVLNFPYDFPRPSVSSGHGDRVYLTFPERLSTELRSISRKESVSLFSVMISSFGILMHKYSGDHDLNIGTPVANRTMADIESMVGMFINTLAFRFIFDHNSSFESVIKRSSENLMEAIENQDVPFEKIVEFVNPERISNVNPLFQVAFAWEDNLEVPVDFKGVKSSREIIKGGSSTFDLTCALADNGKEITGEIEYNTDLFKHDTITRLRDNYIALVSNLVEGYKKPISYIPLITPKEKEKILSFTDTATPYPSEKTISELFEEQAEKYPDKDAVVYENQSVTYDQLNRKSNSLARRLIEKGIRKNKPVGILADKSIDLITGIHAILKSGGAYLPLDTDYPAERIKFMLSDAGCNVVLTHGKYGEILPKDVTKIFIDDPGEYHSDDTNVVTDTTSTDMAYVMYTSGTTGIPKGSMIRHKSVVRLVRNTNYIDLTPEDRILMNAAIVFDVSTFEIWGSLLNGGTLYIFDKSKIHNPRLLDDYLSENGITILLLTSAVFIHFTEYNEKIFRGLKYLFVGGDVLSPRHINMVREANKGLTVINGYGPTENTTNTTCYHIDRDYEHNIPIGKPISNTTVYILDKNLNLQPIGVTGEIYVGGDGLSMGYLNRDDLNNKSFIDNPWKRGEKLYRTGDHGRWQQSGDIEFHGRVDNQVKVRGFRVEPGEIEAALGSIEGVIDVVVKAFKISANDTRLVAFLNVKKTFDKEISEISGILRAKIPSYMVPSIYRIMDGFPLTINGKIDRDALKYEEDRIAEDSNKEDIKLTETEREIHNIWSDVLKIKHIHPDDNFFDIGGNSLLVISVVNRIEQHLNVRIQFRDIITYPTISDLGSFINSKNRKKDSPVKLTHNSNLTDLPLTYSQLRMWLLSKLNPDSPYYIITFIYRLYGSLNIDVFKRSIEILFDRHHVLFSSFYEKQGDILCRIDSQKAQVNVVDLRKHPSKNRKQKMLESINNDSRNVMDLSKGPLYRIYLYMLSGEEYYLYFAVHHIVFDGWSWKIFIEDLNHIYDSLHSSKPVSLNKLKYHQYDFATWEQTLLNVDNKPQLTYWQGQLQGCSPVLNFPYDFPRPSVSSGHGDRVYLTFPEKLSTELRSISREEGVSLFSVIAATFGILMHKYSGDYDLNIGTPIANRTMVDIEPMVGMFNNTLAIRFIFDHNSSFERVIKSISEVIMGAIENQDVPFEKIVELVNPERISNVNPLFQVAFAWEDNLEVPVDFKGVTSSRESIEGGASTFDLTCALADNGKEITGEIEYNTDLFKHDTITRLRDNYLALVSNLVEDYRKPIESIPLITPKEKEKILGFTDTSTPYPSEKTISELFEEQAEKYPDKDAVVYESQSVTYGHLNRKANSLARVLTEKGIEKNTPVGILADKSIDLIAGILAILKSGGAYLPLDTDYPAERIKFMLSDSGCDVVLTHGQYGDILPKDVTKIFIDDPREYHSDDTNVVTDTTSTDMAYIMYTSGTTGIPKGSMIRHKSVVRLVRNTNYIDLTPEDRILMTGAIVFDATTFEIWGSLLNGGTLYILNKEDILDSNALGASLRDNKITILWLTSPLFTQIAGVTTTIFSGLKYLLVGGDVLSPRHINMVREANKGLTVINGYGPTENTTFTTCYHIDRDYDHNIPIGKPVSNTTVYILDKNLNLQPIGVTGEIYVGGDGLSMGYLNRDDLNNKSFIANPWKRGEKLYRTGDHGRWQQSGDIEFHGRVDNQVKVRGFRVEPGEIEAALGSIEGVIDVVVKAFKISANDTRLVAFLNVKKTFDKEISEISGILRAKIPSYMVPSIYRIMDGFPLTINGKIDRDALKYEEDRIAEDSNKEDIKLTETEREIHNIWSDVLKIKNIHPDDNFFDIGGNSLLAITIVAKIETVFKIKLALRVFFDSPRISDLSESVEMLMLQKKPIDPNNRSNSKRGTGEI